MRRVFVPTDFSSYADNAVRSAYGLLARDGGVVQLFHVVVPDRLHASSGEQDEALRQRLRALVPPWAPEKGITTEVGLVHRLDLAHAILEAAEAFSADLICIGSQGRTGLARALLGSVAEDVLRICPLPLLIVPKGKS
jgi:nucleotide-binding universal stress UspA family protein